MWVMIRNIYLKCEENTLREKEVIVKNYTFKEKYVHVEIILEILMLELKTLS
jgi:hypothetical protein